MDTLRENQHFNKFSSPVQNQKTLDHHAFVTPPSSRSTESRTPSYIYKTPNATPRTPGSVYKTSYMNQPRRLYQPIIPELQETLQQGMDVFVRDNDEGWKQGVIATVTDSHLLVNTGGLQKQVKSGDVILQPDKKTNYQRVEDLTKISPLSTPAALHCLRQRYLADEVYTRAGETLVAINPFKTIPQLYEANQIWKYHDEHNRGEPHIFETGEQAYRAMQINVRASSNQSIIVSGESGAGKTVSARHLMKYLVSVSSKGHPSRGDVGKHVEQRVLDSNPVLEAFGNASTLRNHNSSRFGKFIQLHFDNKYLLEGATVQTYLLEKTRVVHQASGECNFHIFYQLLAGLDKEGQQSLGIDDINLSTTESRSKEMDREQWKTTQKALLHLGISAEEQYCIVQVLCGLLLLGAVKLTIDEEDDEVCCIDQGSRGRAEQAAKLLGLDVGELEKSLTHRQITATHRRRQSVFSKPCTLTETVNRLHCLSMLIYSNLFKWLVNRINVCIQSEEPHIKIGLLDIYGFESFEENSLEQLCINYANEKLQQHYVVHFLKELQADYEREAVSWQLTDFTDNRPCLDLLEANPGVFALLNEECYLNRPSCSETLNERLLMTFSGNNYLTPGRRDKPSPQFVIQHFASPVSYSVNGLVEKNKDNVPCELLDLVQRSSEDFVASLLSTVEKDSPGKKKKTVLAKFKSSLDTLMNLLEDTEPHYIRCIKPNPASNAGEFHMAYVLQQLEANGVVEAVDICRKGYPTRILYEHFLKQYSLILRSDYQGEQQNKENDMFDTLDALYHQQLKMTPRRRSSITPKSKLRRRADDTTVIPGLSSSDHSRKLCASILRMVFGSQRTDWSQACSQFGRTKLFLKHGQLEKLESVRMQLLAKYVFTIQCAWRRHKRRQRIALTRLQAAVRGWLVRQDIQRRHEAAGKLQRCVRAWLQRRRTETLSSHKYEEVSSEALMMAGFCPSPSPRTPQRDQDSYVICTETGPDSIIYHIMPSPAQTPHSPATPVRSPHPLATPSRDTNTQLGQTPGATPVRQMHGGTAAAQHAGGSTSSYLDSPCWRTPRRPVPSEAWSPGFSISTPRSYSDAFHTVAAAVSAAFITQRKFHMAGAFNGIPYFEAQNGILSRRRMPKVQIRFHTKANPLLKFGHYMSRQEFQCSLSDCLNEL